MYLVGLVLGLGLVEIGCGCGSGCGCGCVCVCWVDVWIVVVLLCLLLDGWVLFWVGCELTPLDCDVLEHSKSGTARMEKRIKHPNGRCLPTTVRYLAGGIYAIYCIFC